MSREEWLRWFDSSVCETCGRNHPTKFHGDTGARGRTKEEWRALWKDRKAGAKRGGAHRGSGARPPPQFRSAAAKSTFTKKVNKAMLEAVTDEDREFYAHLANDDTVPDDTETAEAPGEDMDMFAALAGDGFDGNTPDDVDEEGVDGIEGDQAQALAIQSLDSLLNW